MNNGFVIQWKSRSNGRAGRGTKQFPRDEAEKLVNELNREYPEINHEVVAFKDLPPEAVEEEENTASAAHQNN